MASLLSTRETRIIRDTANILNEKQCKTFMKDYKDFINGKISVIKHPKTRGVIRDPIKIKYLYNKCAEKYGMGSAMSPANMSKLTNMMSHKISSDNSISYEKELNISSNADIRDILNLPADTFKNNRILIRKLFNKPISEKKGYEILKKYLNDPDNNDQYVINYREYVMHIRKYIDIYDPFMNRAEFQTFINDLYDPNHRVSNDRLLYFIEYCQKVYISILFQDTRSLNMGRFEYDDNYYRAVSTASGFFARLSQNKYEYYALYMMSDIILRHIKCNPEIVRNIIQLRKLMKSLLDKDFVIEDVDVSQSFSTSSSSSKSDDMTKKDSSTNNLYLQLGRREFVKYIMNNGENQRTTNDTDPYLGVKWEKLSINKLRMVVKISTETNGRIFTYAFYARSLYKDWRNSIRTMKPFINPYTRVPFTIKDEEGILDILEKKYPYISKPLEKPVNRFDIHYQEIESVRVNDVYFWRLNIWYNYGTRKKPEYIKIVVISIISHLELYNDSNQIEYLPAFLFENIDKLKNDNKIISKKMPFKLHPAFMKYYNSFITTEAQYKDFFRLLSR